jgi:ankyrin repeat protein
VYCCPVGHADIVKKLIEFDAEFDIEEDIDRTPLFWACYNNHFAVVKLLLEKGARVNIVDHAGLSPTMVASHCGHADILKLLQEHSAYEVFYYTGQKEDDKPAEFIRTRAAKDVDKLCGGGNSLFYKVTNYPCSPAPHSLVLLLSRYHSSIRGPRWSRARTPSRVTMQGQTPGGTRRLLSGTLQ